MKNRIPVLVALAAAVALGALLHSDNATGLSGANSISLIDPLGRDGSIALDAAGNPVVAYQEDNSHEFSLKVLHCNDPYCKGGDESITMPDSPAKANGWGPSLALDAAGNPVITHWGMDGFKLVHCNDPNCAGGGESIEELPASGGILRLDAGGNPVLAAGDGVGHVILIHCNDANCAGGDESVSPPLVLGSSASLALDASGNPVISSANILPGDGVRITHCNDPNCLGGDESITVPDPQGEGDTSLFLDAAGNPVVSYWVGGYTGDTKLMHCNDPNCTGGDESITTPDPGGDRGGLAVLDAGGNPVLTTDTANWGVGLRLVRCNDPNCAGGNETVAPLVPTSGGSSLVLDGADNPVLALTTGPGLNVLHCAAPDCASDTDGDGCADLAEERTDWGSERTGGRRDPKSPYDFYDIDGNRVVDLFMDVFSVAGGFGDDADASSETGNPEPDGYDATLDRSAPPMAGDPWDTQAPDGVIDMFTDVFGVANQFGHDCA